jgi:hypothetical protein
MNPRVKDAKPNPDYMLKLTFNNGEVNLFDVKPYLNIGIFKELKDMSLFNSVRPFLGSIQWRNGQDLCPDTLYLESVLLDNSPASDSDETVAEKAAIDEAFV